jgi:drug/metabolite transporter (DMT)-like permease
VSERHALLVLAMLLVASAAVLTRLTGMPPLAVAFWRTALAGGMLGCVLWRSIPWGIVPWRQLALSGLALALHFALWIASLDMIPVALSVLLVCTQPIFVALASRCILGEQQGVVVWLGIALALTGTAWATGLGWQGRLLGQCLALGGAVAAAAYVLLGRRILGGSDGERLGPLRYSCLTYLTAACWLLPCCLLSGQGLFGHAASSWLFVAAIVVGPQLMGHTLINQALRHLQVTTVAVAFLLEPPAAALLAWLCLGETVPGRFWPGAVVTLLGIALVARAQGGKVLERQEEVRP